MEGESSAPSVKNSLLLFKTQYCKHKIQVRSAQVPMRWLPSCCRFDPCKWQSLLSVFQTLRRNANFASCYALLIQRQNASLPSWICGLGIRTALQRQYLNGQRASLPWKRLRIRVPSVAPFERHYQQLKLLESECWRFESSQADHIEISPVAQLAEHLTSKQVSCVFHHHVYADRESNLVCLMFQRLPAMVHT